MAKPFRLAGTLAHPSLAIDTQAVMTIIGKAVEGVAQSGAAGILAGLESTSLSDNNPCLTAIEAARRGVVKPEKKPEESKKLPEAVKTGIEELKKLFNK